MNMQAVLEYLTALEQNNNREWFHANHGEYEAACKEFENLVAELTAALREMDRSIPPAQAKELTFRLTRDTRFSHDKSPYNPSFRAHIGPKGKLPIPVGYFLMVMPGGRSFLGGGLFSDMFKDATAMMRDYLAAHGEEWQEIITAPAFVQQFAVKGAALKKVPQGYDCTYPQAEFLKNKSWYLEYPVSDGMLLEEGFIGQAAELFAAMKPFNGFLNRALEGFVMPSR